MSLPRLWFVFSCLPLAAALGCGDDDGPGSCTPGALGCECSDGVCLTGLVCRANRCIDPAAPRTDAGMTVGPTDAGMSIPDVGPDPDAFFADDPPPMECREDGTMGAPAEVPGGTPDCPDDKNRQGCRCINMGEEAPCWPGLRANRNRGICQDGVTRCEPFDEFTGRWGECRGAVLPQEGATLGPAACTCFSAGRWEIDNTTPCFTGTEGGSVYAVSTIPGAGEGGGPGCPPPSSGPPAAPAAPWSANRLTVDCEGRFELCFTLKAGDNANPLDTDCTVARVCTETWYEERGVTQELPQLPSWTTTETTCATQFYSTGGYAELSVRGLSVECDEISDDGEHYVFQRVNYCPAECNGDNPPPELMCELCANGGAGNF